VFSTDYGHGPRKHPLLCGTRVGACDTTAFTILTELGSIERVQFIGTCDTTESSVRSLWEKADLNWVWTWMAIYGGSLSVLAAYLASTFAAAAAEELKIKNSRALTRSSHISISTSSPSDLIG
jgi:hypothetical protein